LLGVWSELYIPELEEENLRIFNKLIGRLENEIL